MILFYIYVLITGLIVGSFLNVCICRFPLGETVVKGRSICRSCHHVIAWYDNIPLLSYLLLRGRCRSCGASISPRYPVVELLNAVLWLLCALQFGLSMQTLLFCLLLSALVVAAWIDFDTQEVPDRISVFIAILSAVGFVLDPSLLWWERLIGGVIISVPMLLLACFCGGFGGADIKLSAACGLLLGWQAMLLAAFLAVIAAAFVAVIRLIRKTAHRGDQMAFVPYLAIGVAVAALYHWPILYWYASLF